MDDGKENDITEGFLPRRNKRRNSILKESPSRIPLQDVFEGNSMASRRSLKRVSFADTNTIKEFIQTLGGNTEWNSSYETPAAADSTSSLSSNLTSDGRSNDTDVENKGCDDSNIMDMTACNSQTLNNSLDASYDYTNGPSNFLSEFLNITSAAPPSEELNETQGMELTTAASQVARLTQVVTREDVTQRIGEHMELTAAASQVARMTQGLTREDVTQRIGDGMELTAAASQVARMTQIVTREDVTQRIGDAMELTTAASQVAKLATQVERSNKNIEGIGSSTNTASPLNETTDLSNTSYDPSNFLNQFLNLNSETESQQHQGVTREDATQRIGDNMEMTTAASQVARMTQGVTRENVTQRIGDAMELTTAASQLARMTQGVTLDVTQRIGDAMELTTAASQLARMTQGMTREDVTQRMGDGMELTAAASQVAGLTQGMTREDMTQRIGDNMELTLGTKQIARLTDQTQENIINVGKKTQGNKSNIMQGDSTQRLCDAMELTMGANQISKFGQKNHIGKEEDMTKRIGFDMELTAPANQISKLTGPIKQVSIGGNHIGKEEDVTKRIGFDMELTTPVNQFSQVSQPSKLIGSIKQVSIAGNHMEREEDMTKRIGFDMELTTPANQFSQVSQPSKLIGPVKKVSIVGNHMEKEEDMTKRIGFDMELTAPANQFSQVSGLTQGEFLRESQPSKIGPIKQQVSIAGNRIEKEEDMTKRIGFDMELTTPANQFSQVSGLTQGEFLGASQMSTLTGKKQVSISGNHIEKEEDMTKRIGFDMELTAPANQVSKIGQKSHAGKYTEEDTTKRIGFDMELTTPANQISKLTGPIKQVSIAGNLIEKEEDMTRRVGFDMELTAPANQVSKLIGPAGNRIENDEDMTKRIGFDMELTTPANQVSKLIGPAGNRIEKDEDMTKRIGFDMELTAPANQFSQVSQPSKLTGSIKQVSIAGNHIEKEEDMTKRIGFDMELTAPANQISKLTGPIKHVSIAGNHIEKDEDMTKRIGFDMELTTPANQFSKVNQFGTLTQADNFDLTAENMELTTADQGKLTHDLPASQIQAERERIADNMELNTADQGRPTHVSIGSQLSLIGSQSSVIGSQSSVIGSQSSIIRSQSSVIGNQPSVIRSQSLIGSQSSSENMTKNLNPNLEGQEINQKVRRWLSVGSQSGLSPETKDPSRRKTGPIKSQSFQSFLETYKNPGGKPESGFDAGQQKDCSDPGCELGSVTAPDHSPPSRKRSSLSHSEQPSPKRPTQDNAGNFNTSPRQNASNINTASLQNLNANQSRNTAGEELLDDINLSLVESMGDSVDGCFESPTPASRSVFESPASNVQSGRRKSLAAEGLSTVMPLISSIMERLNRTNATDSSLHDLNQSDVNPNRASLSRLSLGSQAPQDYSENSTLESDAVLMLPDAEDFEAIKDSNTSLNTENSNTSSNAQGLNTESLNSQGLNTGNSNTSLNSQGLNTEIQNDIPAIKITRPSIEEDEEEEKEEEEEENIYKAEQNEQNTSRTSQNNSSIFNTSKSSKVNEEYEQYNMESEIMEEEMEQNISVLSSKKSVQAASHENECVGYCSLSAGDSFTLACGERWTVLDVGAKEWSIQLGNTPLILKLSTSISDQHIIINSATTSLNSRNVTTKCGKLVLSTLGCRIGAAVAGLCGVPLCEAENTLTQVWSAFKDNVALMFELQNIAANYITTFTHNSVNVTLMSIVGHVMVDIEVKLDPPHPQPHLPYTLTPSCNIFIGNLRKQMIDEVMAGVGPGPRQLYRLIEAVHLYIKKLTD